MGSLPRTYCYMRFGLLRFRSPLLSESFLLSFPPGTKMFQFPGFPSCNYGFIARYCNITCSAFPHSDICGSQLICSSPQLFAACHVLPRRHVPRHPPYALCSLIVLVYFPYIQNSNFNSANRHSQRRPFGYLLLFFLYAFRTNQLALLAFLPFVLSFRLSFLCSCQASGPFRRKGCLNRQLSYDNTFPIICQVFFQNF